VDSRFRACCQTPIDTVEIAARFFESLAMTHKSTPCHCEERNDEAISSFSTNPFAGMTNIENEMSGLRDDKYLEKTCRTLPLSDHCTIKYSGTPV
jgi:hypothetical protein